MPKTCLLTSLSFPRTTATPPHCLALSLERHRNYKVTRHSHLWLPGADGTLAPCGPHLPHRVSDITLRRASRTTHGSSGARDGGCCPLALGSVPVSRLGVTHGSAVPSAWGPAPPSATVSSCPFCAAPWDGQSPPLLGLSSRSAEGCQGFRGGRRRGGWDRRGGRCRVSCLSVFMAAQDLGQRVLRGT